MEVATIFYIILGITVFEFCLTKYLSYLNTTYWSDTLPKELADIYDQEKYAQSQTYEKAKYQFGNIQSFFSLAVILVVLVF